jgi:hypothetical protein
MRLGFLTERASGARAHLDAGPWHPGLAYIILYELE